MGRGWAIRTLKFIEVSYESGTLHKHCGDNLKPIPKDNSEYAVLCPLLRGSTIFFFWLSMGTRWVIRTFNFKEVSNVGGNLHNHCSDNLKPDVKDSSEYAVLCSLLRSSPVYLFIYLFFFVALHGFTFKLQQFNRSEVLSQNSKQQSCFWKSVYSCCKMFSTYSFPNGISNYICGLTVKRFRSPLKKTPNSKFPFLKFSLELLLQRVHRLQFS